MRISLELNWENGFDRLIAIVLLWCMTLCAAAVEKSFSSEFIGADLAHGRTPQCALRDHMGFLWVGTHSGLACYDGNGQNVYEPVGGVVPSTEGMNVSALFELGDDILFGGTPGLCVFRRRSNTSSVFPMRTRYGVPVSSPVRKILDADGGAHIWIFTRGQGFFVYDTADSTLTQNSRHGSFFNDAITDGGRVYAAGIDGKLQIFATDGKYIRSIDIPGYVTDKNPISLAITGRDVWVACNTSLYRYDPLEQTMNLASADEIGGEISALLPDDNGNVLIGTDGGILLYDMRTAKVERMQSDAEALRKAGRSVTALTRDSDLSFLVVSPAGVDVEKPFAPDFRQVKMNDDFDADGQVSAIVPAADGVHVWVGTDRGLLWLEPDTGVKERRPVPGLDDVAVTSLTVDGDNLWIGTRHHGLLRYNTVTQAVENYIYDESIPYAVISNDINDVFRTSAGEIFVLTTWGLTKYNAEKDNFVTLKEIGSHTPFVAMQEDSRGRLWAATASDGLYCRDMEGEMFHGFDSPALGHRPLSELYLDSRGILWAVQGNKVYFLDENSDDFVPLAISMSREHPVMFLQEGNNGDMWIGTCESLIRVTADDHIPTYFAYRAGEHVNSAPAGAACRLDTGDILFGSADGFWRFDPRIKRGTNRHVRAYVQSISFPYLDDSQAEVERLGLNSLLYTRDEIKIPYADNTFTLRFSASRQGDMPPVRFDYQLEGVDKVWIRDAGSHVTYTDLRPGTYIFRLRPNIVTDAPIEELTIIVLPPWYLTTPAYIAYALCIMLIVFAALLLYRRRMNRHYQWRINELQTQRERETFESKMRFFVNLVHEIRTPLTLINIPLEQMAEEIEETPDSPASKPEATKALARHITSMRRNVSYLLGITNQLLDFRKAEHDSEVQLNYRRCNVSELLRDIVDRFVHSMNVCGKELTLNMPPEDIYAVIDIDKVDRVVMNILGNAMKYSRHKVDVTLEVSADGKFNIIVADDGPGIPQKERPRIFDTYYQIDTERVSASLGTGLGLAYAKLIANAHGGDIGVRDSGDGEGASFVITLPLGDPAKTKASDELMMRPEARIDTVALPEISSRNTEDGAHKVTLLIVDDNAELLQSLCEALGRWYGIVTATGGQEALQALVDHPEIDIIVSDFMMPYMDGAELARKVKANPETSYIPFIMLTAKTGPDARMEGIESGADVFIEKPFSVRQLRKQIENILRTRELFHRRIQEGRPVLTSSEGLNSADGTPLLNRVDGEFIELLNSLIGENINDEEFSIDVLAKQMNMSRSSFYRRIKAITGLTPVDYLKNYRLDYSARLLRDGVRVTEVAIQAGFTSSSYFAKCFKAKFGIIPKDYATNHSS